MAHHAIQLGPNNGIALLGRQADKYAHPWNQDLVGMGVNRIGKEFSLARVNFPSKYEPHMKTADAHRFLHT
jgi:hypothetical protein